MRFRGSRLQGLRSRVSGLGNSGCRVLGFKVQLLGVGFYGLVFLVFVELLAVL